MPLTAYLINKGTYRIIANFPIKQKGASICANTNPSF